MTLKDSVQTAFLVVGFFTILVFGASYYFMSLDTKPTDQPLKDSLAITASFFGGLATLTAAYIATRLYVDWKIQTKYSEQLKNISRIAIKFKKIPDIINQIRSDHDNAIYLSNCYDYIHGKTNILDKNLIFNVPDFTSINQLLSDLKDTLVLIRVYSLSKSISDIEAEIHTFEDSLKAWKLGFDTIYSDFIQFNESKIKATPLVDYAYLFCDCNSEFYKMNSTDLSERYSIYNHNEIHIYQDQIGILVAIGAFLEDLDNI